MAEGKRGFASMDREKQKLIASQGGKAAHAKGSAHEFTADEARAAGRKGGLAVSQNKEHMSAIGREGGKSRGRNVARRLAEQRAGQEQAARGEEIPVTTEAAGAGERIEQEAKSETAFLGGPGQSELAREDSVESAETESFEDDRKRGGRGGPDRGE